MNNPSIQFFPSSKLEIPWIKSKELSLESQLYSHNIKLRNGLSAYLSNLVLKIQTQWVLTFQKNEEFKLSRIKELEARKVFPIDISERKRIYLSENEVNQDLLNILLKALQLDNINLAKIPRGYLADLEATYGFRGVNPKLKLVGEIERFIKAQDWPSLKGLIHKRLEVLKKYEKRREAVRKAIRAPIKTKVARQLEDCIKNISLKNIEWTVIEKEGEIRENYLKLLGGGSSTINNVRDLQARIAQENLLEAEVLVRSWAKDDVLLTLERISSLNRVLTKNLENNGGEPGVYRIPGHKVSAPIKSGFSEYSAYLAGDHVESEMKDLCQWINVKLKQAQGNQAKIIEIAARAMSWAISIHPFHDGNGRTCRMLANYILMKGGLPPAIIDNNRGNMGRFGDALVALDDPEEDKGAIAIITGPAPEVAIGYMVQSIEETLKIIK